MHTGSNSTHGFRHSLGCCKNDLHRLKRATVCIVRLSVGSTGGGGGVGRWGGGRGVEDISVQSFFSPTLCLTPLRQGITFNLELGRFW